jgi:hypothetical protein
VAKAKSPLKHEKIRSAIRISDRGAEHKETIMLRLDGLPGQQWSGAARSELGPNGQERHIVDLNLKNVDFIFVLGL